MRMMLGISCVGSAEVPTIQDVSAAITLIRWDYLAQLHGNIVLNYV